MFFRNWKPWSPAALLGLFAWDSIVPLSSLADIGEPRIGIVSDAFLQPVAFEAIGLPIRELRSLKSANSKTDAFSQFFAVFETNGSDEVSTPALSGTYVIDGGRLRFVPLHPLRVGLNYRAIFQVQGGLPSDRPQQGISIHCDVTVQEVLGKPAIPSA